MDDMDVMDYMDGMDTTPRLFLLPIFSFSLQSSAFSLRPFC